MTGYRGYNDHETKLLANIEKYGCQVTFVFDAEGDEPDFCYSIGFSKSIHQPEVIVFGLPRKLMHSMVNNILEQCRDGLILADGLVIRGLLEGHDCIAQSVHSSQIVGDYFGSAMWFHRDQFGSELVEAFQIVWPGAKDGKFPWDADSSEQVRSVQPALYEPRLAA